MKISKISLLLLIAVILMGCFSQKEKVLKINGTVINSDTKTILLMKPSQDLRFDSLIEIPVENGKFYYESKLEYPEVVNLVLGEAREKGYYRPMPLFIENDSINLTIYPEEEFDKNIVQGGTLNAEYIKYKTNIESEFNDRLKPLHDSVSSLLKSNLYNSEKMKEVRVELGNAKDPDERIVVYKKIDDLKEAGLDLSPNGKILDNKLKILLDEKKKWQQQYIDKNPNIISYSFFLEDLIYNEETIDMNLAKSNYEKLAEANLNHPYNDLASNLINAIENIKIGKKYVDFSAPDLNGNSVELSDKIKGKVALLDLWATWCGPCIAKSRTMVPIYNEYKDRGFTIVGVAGEFKNTDRLVKFLDKEKWPWQNLVELDRQNNIWQKYGVDGGGGGIFLIDNEGKIIAKDPTAEEVREKLELLEL